MIITIIFLKILSPPSFPKNSRSQFNLKPLLNPNPNLNFRCYRITRKTKEDEVWWPTYFILQFISINYRTSDNDWKTLNLIKSFQRIYNTVACYHNDGVLTHKIFSENGAPFIYLKTSLIDRPLKLLVDTGASISLIATDVINKNIRITKYIVNLYGVIGKEVSIQTHGMIHGVLAINGRLLGTTLHLVDRKFTGPADGILGYDFLSFYKVVIDMTKMCLQLDLCNVVSGNPNNIETPNNPTNTDNLGDKSRNCIESAINYIEYDEAADYYRKQFDEVEQYKVHAVYESNSKAQTGIFNSRSATNDVNNTLNRSHLIFNKLNMQHCTREEMTCIENICKEIPFQFYIDGDTLGCTEVIKHKINPRF